MSPAAHPTLTCPVFEDLGTPEHTPRAPPLEHRFDRLYVILISLHGLVRWPSGRFAAGLHVQDVLMAAGHGAVLSGPAGLLPAVDALQDICLLLSCSALLAAGWLLTVLSHCCACRCGGSTWSWAATATLAARCGAAVGR